MKSHRTRPSSAHLLRAALVIAALALPAAAFGRSDEDPALTIVLAADGGMFGVGYGSATADATPVILDPHLTRLEVVPDAPVPPALADDCAAEANLGAVSAYVAKARAYVVAKADALTECGDELDDILDAIDGMATIGGGGRPSIGDPYVVVLPGGAAAPILGMDMVVRVCSGVVSDHVDPFAYTPVPSDCGTCAFDVAGLASTATLVSDQLGSCSEIVLQAEGIRLSLADDLADGTVSQETFCNLSAVSELRFLATRYVSGATRASDGALDSGIDLYCSAAVTSDACDRCNHFPTPVGGMTGTVHETPTPVSLLNRLRAHFKGAAAKTKDAGLAASYAVIAKALGSDTGVRHFVFPALGGMNVRYVVLADPASQGTKVFIATGLVGSAPGNAFDVAALQALWKQVRAIRPAPPQ